MTTNVNYDADVIIAGTGPTALALANLLGLRGISVLILEKRAQLIDYPRGVGLDDESFRTIQAMDLVEEVTPFTIPHHIMRMVDGQGDVILTNNPKGQPFGWPRKFGFLQPLVDNALYEGLSRFDNIEVRFGRELMDLAQGSDSVTVSTRRVTGEEGETPTGETETITGKYMIGCEGGRSFTRKWIGAEFVGESPSTRWVVVDCNNDPLGFPNVYLGADPRRPYVSIGLPRGVRRFEFMLFDDEPSEKVEDDAFIADLLDDHLPENTELDIIRRRVFTHHGRIADQFRKGRVLIAGDAAHLMPVWLGQGFNSAFRDVTNLAWKLEAVIRGHAKSELLDTYGVERRDHAKAMIDLSMTMGNIIKPTDKKVAFVRDQLAKVVNVVPQAREYFEDMKFKPMPRYERGAVVDQGTLEPGVARRKASSERRAKLVASRVAVNKNSPVGAQFIQPKVRYDGKDLLLDDAIGQGFAVISWGVDPARLFSEAQVDQLREVGARLFCAVSPTQVDWAAEYCAGGGTEVISDTDGALKNWFDQHCVGTVFVRPDRFVAATCLNGDTSRAWDALVSATHFNVN